MRRRRVSSSVRTVKIDSHCRDMVNRRPAEIRGGPGRRLRRHRVHSRHRRHRRRMVVRGPVVPVAKVVNARVENGRQQPPVLHCLKND